MRTVDQSSTRSALRKKAARGITLVETLIVVSIIALVSGAVMWGPGTFSSVRLQRAAVLLSSAVRVGMGHANATSKVVRIALDFEDRSITLEESNSAVALTKNDRTGGAAPATQLEHESVAEAEKILKGPAPPRPAFKAAKAFGFDPDKEKPGKALPPSIRYLQVETGHDEQVATSGRAYIYFWPGGVSERAAVQLSSSAVGDDTNTLTVLVSPLTGRTEIKRGRAQMVRPRDDLEDSERQDTGF